MGRVLDLQETVEKQNTELTAARTRILELNNKLTELDENYTTSQKELVKAQEAVNKLQRDLREVTSTHHTSVGSFISVLIFTVKNSHFSGMLMKFITRFI